ncbi:hypothetical protein [Rhodoflexus sp.]
MHAFVGRSKEIAFASECITRLTDSEASREEIRLPVILNFYGEPGVGKTVLIQRLLALYQEQFPSLPQVAFFDHDASFAPSTQ